MKSDIDLTDLVERFDDEMEWRRECAMTSAERERQELELLAWRLYQPLLAEEPAYLEQIVAGLAKKTSDQMQKIGRSINRRKH